MEASDELKKWIDSLTVSEKRYIKLMGKARAGSSSQQLILFDLLNKAQPVGNALEQNRFQQNLHTVSNRLKDLILDGLRILHKEADIDSLLRTALDEIAVLHRKKLIRPLARQLKRAKKLALETSRYHFALQCIEWEIKTIPDDNPPEKRDKLTELRNEEITVLKKMEDLRSLISHHEIVLSYFQQYLHHRDPEVQVKVREHSESELVHRLSEAGHYLEKALAFNILGMRDLYERNPMGALIRYQSLLKEWQQHPQWQIDQTELLLQMCKYYQLACYYSPVDWNDARTYISMVGEFKGLSTEAQCDFQRMLYHNQFMLALNMGKFDSVATLIPEIDDWLTHNAKLLTESQVLPYLCNFAVAEFLGGNFASANKIVYRIITMSNRKARTDIRDFARMLQPVLQYELDQDRLDEYLTRAGMRHFNKQSNEINFELSIFKYLDVLANKGDRKAASTSLDRLITELDTLAEQLKDAIPLLGLNEIRIWAQSKKEKIPIREVFLRAVKEHMDELRKAETV